MGEMLQKMKMFFGDWRRYGKDSKKHDVWIKKHAANRGWSVNSRFMMYTMLKFWLSDSEAMYGRRYCPCYEPSADAELNRKLICPCHFAQAEIDSTGWCHCTLFGRGDLTAADYKRAEDQLMAEYRGGPLGVTNGVLDTRGQPIEELRGLPVPDAIHMTKRALIAVGTPLKVIVATQTEADHLRRLAELREMPCSQTLEDDHILVELG